jgi:Autoinducer synthase
MIQIITADRYGAFIDDLAEMHRLRYRIFKERLGWDVHVSVVAGTRAISSERPMRMGWFAPARSASIESALSSQKGEITPSRTQGSGRHGFPPRPFTANETLSKGSGTLQSVRRISSANSSVSAGRPCSAR